MLKITTPQTAPRVPFQLDGRIMLSRPGLEVILLTLKPGEVVPKHVNDFDVAMYVLSGQILLETSNDSAQMHQAMLAEINRGEERGIINTGQESAMLLILKLLP